MALHLNNRSACNYSARQHKTVLLFEAFIFLLGLLFLPLPGKAANIPDAHTASYEVLKKGISVAEAEFTLTIDGTKLNYQLDIHVSGIFHLFRDDTYHEQASLQYQNNQLQLNSYQHEQKSGDKHESIRSEINPAERQIQTNINGELRTLHYNGDMLDKLSVQLLMISHARQSHESREFQVFDGENIKLYRFSYLGNEEIELDEDVWIKTEKWQSQRDDSDRENIYWFAPGYRFIPVQMQQHNHGKLDTTLILTNINWQ